MLPMIWFHSRSPSRLRPGWSIRESNDLLPQKDDEPSPETEDQMVCKLCHDKLNKSQYDSDSFCPRCGIWGTNG